MPRSRSRSRSPPSEPIQLPYNAKQISEADYFQKSDEFRVWLKDEKGRYLDELTSEKARSYFRKFTKAWNRGKLHKFIYAGVEPLPAAAQTGFKWSFATKSSRGDEEALRAAREDVEAATRRPSSSSRPQGSGRMQGPTLPSSADLILAREQTAEDRDAERGLKRKRDKLEQKDRLEEMIGPKSVGKEAMLEKKRARRDADKSFREKGDEGLELDESTLLGGGDSFKDHLARREAARSRRAPARDEKAAELRDRGSQLKEKDNATMAMFQQMAKQRFG